MFRLASNNAQLQNLRFGLVWRRNAPPLHEHKYTTTAVSRKIAWGAAWAVCTGRGTAAQAPRFAEPKMEMTSFSGNRQSGHVKRGQSQESKRQRDGTGQPRAEQRGLKGRGPIGWWPLSPEYLEQSRRPLVSLAFIVPLLATYEGGVIYLGPAALRNGADIWLRHLLGLVGFGQYFLLPALTVGLLLAWHHMTHAAVATRAKSCWACI